MIYLTEYQKLWRPCPECGATATIMNCYGDEYAGIWECINPECGASDNCEHDHRDTVTVELPGTIAETEVYVCDDCDCTIDGSPAEDRHEANVDMQIDEMRGN